jgi:hypothetical protein
MLIISAEPYRKGFDLKNFIDMYLVSILKWEGKSLIISVIPKPYTRSTNISQILIGLILY